MSSNKNDLSDTYTIDQKKAEHFMWQLYKLTQQTGIAISGCGCCGSPFLMNVPTTGKYVSNSNRRRDSYDEITWEPSS